MEQLIKQSLFLFISLLIGLPLMAQEQQVLAKKTASPIQVDGRLNEDIWSKGYPVSDFQMSYPHDTLKAKSKTIVQVLFDDRFLYIGAVCEDLIPGDYVVQSLKRDFDFEINDGFAVFIDAFSDATNGLGFAVNPYGVQWDGIIADGGNKGVTTSWDGLWYAEVLQHPLETYWSVEIAIPLKTLRFKSSVNQWRINFARNDLKRNELSTYVPIPRGFEVATMTRMAPLIWENPPKKPGPNVTLIPYLAGGVVHNQNTSDPSKTNFQSSSGLDAKIALNSSLNLDITINPDFSQVEVDRQIINLQRFEVFFPERRFFFLENSDLFSALGNSRIRPFFSRRIGSAGSDPLAIQFGARVSGKLNRDWRLGLMGVQTKAPEESSNNQQNYFVAVLQRRILKASSFTAFLTSQQDFNNFKPTPQYNRITGMEFDYRSKKSKVTAKAFAHYSFSPGHDKNALAYSGKVRYKTKKMSVFLGLDAVEENYLSDVGYVPRLYHEDPVTDSLFRIPYTQTRSNGYYRFFLKNNALIDFIGPEFRFNLFTDNHFNYQEYNFRLSFVLQLLNSSRLKLSYTNDAPILFFPFSLSGLSAAFPAGNYLYRRFLIDYDTGKRKNFSGKVQLGYGGEYTGRRFSLKSEVNYRSRRHIVIGLTFSQQNLSDFPEAFGSANFTLIGSKIELSFSRKVFFTTFLQYNTQKNNFNINSRFNWRFHPMSDLYIVYTENYLADALSIKDRALVLKMNYWIGF
ncbi:MAG: DUF5916 domain-containing protein [Bacteroidota bacterium]